MSSEKPDGTLLTLTTPSCSINISKLITVCRGSQDYLSGQAATWIAAAEKSLCLLWQKRMEFLQCSCVALKTPFVFPVSQGSSVKHRRIVTKHSQLFQYQWIVNNLSMFVNFNFVVSKELAKKFYYTKSILELRSNRTLEVKVTER